MQTLVSHEVAPKHLSKLVATRTSRRAILGGLAMVTAMAIAPAVGAQSVAAHAAHGKGKPVASTLKNKVRAATARYVDINVAIHEGWIPGTPCVSGPQAGAMGVHYILPSRVPDGMLNANEPEALIYEPQPNGSFRLVGVEFIVLAGDWANLHSDGSTPALEGHLTNYVGEPNRYGLPAFYELHVWAWENNPSGTFADWNTQVSCDNQPAT
jgi:hypothetical protein